MRNGLVVALLGLAVAGCATVGREISDAQLETLRKGVTTETEAVATLGQPTSVMRLGDGSRRLTYSFAHAQARPESFIPVVGLAVGGSDVRSSVVILSFDRAGVLQDYMSHTTRTGAGTGFASGTYRAPDRSLPQEAAQ